MPVCYAVYRGVEEPYDIGPKRKVLTKVQKGRGIRIVCALKRSRSQVELEHIKPCRCRIEGLTCGKKCANRIGGRRTINERKKSAQISSIPQPFRGRT